MFRSVFKIALIVSGFFVLYGIADGVISNNVSLLKAPAIGFGVLVIVVMAWQIRQAIDYVQFKSAQN